jgi:hypothetical protein
MRLFARLAILLVSGCLATAPVAAQQLPTVRDTARAAAVKVQTDSVRAETCRGGTLTATGCKGAKYSTRVTVLRRLATRVDSIEAASLKVPSTPPPPPPPPAPTYTVTIAPATSSICAKPCFPHYTILLATVKDATGQLVNGPVTWHTSDTTAASYWINGTVADARRLEVFDPLRTATLTVRARFTANGATAEGTTTVVLTGAATTPPPPPPDTTTPPPPPPPSDTARFDGKAELPRATIALPPLGPLTRPLRVAAGGNLQAALDSARRGDVILLAPGATYVGSFKLRAKPGTAADGWIVVTTDTPLPAPGTRVTPASAASFAKLRTPSVEPAIETLQGASGWRLVGLDIGALTGVADNYGLVVLDAQSAVTSLAHIPADLLLERVYVHGHSAMSTSRCVSLQSARTAIVDSYLSECHAKDRDSQAIAGWGGPGPYLIQNNYLEGAGENVMFGGADPALQDVSPSDITIRGNVFYKPLTWQGRVWLVKNLLELKHAKRVLIEGNLFQHSWGDGQDGRAFIWQSINQGGGWGSWSTVQDVVFRYNRVHKVSGVFNFSERYDGSSVPAARFSIRHNLFTEVGGLPGTGGVYAIGGHIADLMITRNTGFGVKGSAGGGNTWLQFALGTPQPTLVFTDNIGGDAQYNIHSPIAGGLATIDALAIPRANFARNVMVDCCSSGTQWAWAGWFPTTRAAVGLAADFSVPAGLPWSGVGADVRRVPAPLP